MKRVIILILACIGVGLVFCQPDEAMEADFTKWISTFVLTKSIGGLLCFCAFKLDEYWYESRD